MILIVTSPNNDLERRVAALEQRMDTVGADALAARHLAAAVDRDIADLTVKVDANRKAINALSDQTRERFDAVDRRFDAVDQRFDAVDQRLDALETTVDAGFAEMRGKFDQVAGGLDAITRLLAPDTEEEGGE